MSEHTRGAWRGRASLLLSLILSIVTEGTSALHTSALHTSAVHAAAVHASALHAPALHASSSSSDACLTHVRAAVSAVTLQLVDRIRLPSEARAEMMRETIQIWRAAGVDVRWSKLPVAGSPEMTAMAAMAMEPSHPQVMVIVTPDMPGALTSAPAGARAMASILFIENRPTKLIGAYPAEVQRLLESMRTDARALTERPAALRHRLMGRVLGRAIAHELGHYLFGSSDHAPTGLMRARHRLDDLTSPFRQAFDVIAAQPLACRGLMSRTP